MPVIRKGRQPVDPHWLGCRILRTRDCGAEGVARGGSQDVGDSVASCENDVSGNLALLDTKLSF